MKMKSIALGIATALVSASVAVAAQPGAAAKKLLVNSPPSGNKTVIYMSKNTTGTVVIQERNPTTREQTCVQDAAGNRTCREVVR